MGALLGSGFVPGNDIVTLQNGDEIFPAMLGAIRGARKSINFETYIYWDGEIGREVAQALAERARAGVAVHVTLDAQGASKIGRKNLAAMKDAGVKVERYHTVYWLDPRRFNNRTHRKLLIVDGRTAFIGGVGIADLWLGHAQDPHHWRDNHYRVTGPVVSQLQAIFLDNWLKTTGEVLHGPDYFPVQPTSGPYLVQAFKSSPRYGDIEIELMYRLALAAARKSVLIENAYFLPGSSLREAIIAAARRGVKVEILTPGKHIDQKLVRLASRKYWPEFLRSGVRIYEYSPTMMHVKLLVVDGIFTSIGSANFDERSVRLNDEANLNVLDRRFAAEQTRLFERDKARAQEARLDEHGRLELAEPIQQAAALASPQM